MVMMRLRRHAGRTCLISQIRMSQHHFRIAAISGLKGFEVTTSIGQELIHNRVDCLAVAAAKGCLRTSDISDLDGQKAVWVKLV